jgi:exopolyphosphatase/guanosine-5'-triphosphate,3'-diphosphate pyrophosphatase
MRVAVVDIGSNTARLLVADVGADDAVATVDLQRSYLRLGAEIERHGLIGPGKITEAASVAGAFADRARSLGAERLTVIVTAPGRQAEAAEPLLRALRSATRAHVHVLSADQEGRLAYEGALAHAGPLPEVVAVVDVGGGSTEIAVGTPLAGAAWVQSIDLGSLRLTRQLFRDDPPGRRAVDAARAAVGEAFSGIRPPTPDVALAVGGSARAIAKIAGPVLDPGLLEELAGLLARRPAARALRGFGIGATRAETVLGGALLLAEASRLLGRPLELAAGGLREGAALALAHEAAEAAAA